jgi:HAMP domain-containing protein
MKVTSIKTKLLLSILAALAGIALATGWLIRQASEQNVQIVSEQAVRDAGAALASMERADVAKLDATLQGLMAHPGLAEAFVARDRERLVAIATPIFERLRKTHDVTHWYFHEPSRTNFVRVHRPAQHGDVVSRATLAKAIATSAVGAGKELGIAAQFALRVVEPYVVNGAVVGYVELGQEIDHFLARMKEQTGDDYALLIDKTFVDRAAWARGHEGKRDPWDDLADRVVVNATTADGAIVRFDGDLAALPEGGKLLEELATGGRALVRGVVPVADAAGRRVGALFVVHDITAMHASMMHARGAVFAVLAGSSALLALWLLFLVQRLVFARLARMTATMEDLSARLAGGDYDIVAPPPGPPDELGRFEDFFGRFLSVVAGLLKELTRTRKAG